MTDQQIQQLIKDTVLIATNSTKQENSGLYSTLIKKLEKIDSLVEKFENHQKDDQEWKLQAEPIIKMGRNLQGFGKVAGLIFVAIMGVSAIIGVFYGLVKWLKE